MDKTVSVSSYSARVIEKDAPWSNGWRFEVYSSSGPALYPLSAAFCAVDSTYGDKYVGFGDIPLDQWTYIVGVYKPGYMATYANGHLIQVDTNVTTLKYDGSGIIIGASNSLGYFFNGTIDELKISNVAYSNAWIEGQYLSMSNSLIRFGEEISISSTIQL